MKLFDHGCTKLGELSYHRRRSTIIDWRAFILSELSASTFNRGLRPS